MSLPAVSALIGYVVFLIGLGIEKLVKKLRGLLPLILIVLLCSGCTQWKRLTGAEDKDKQNVEDISGVWMGHLTLSGDQVPVHFILIQKGNAITWGYRPDDASMLSINYGGYGRVELEGSVSGRSFTMTGHYPAPDCPNAWTFSGEVSNGSMLVTVETQGNNVPGTYCYPLPINQTITMTR